MPEFGQKHPWHFLPCPECCPPAGCIYFEDDYDREDSTNLGGDWTEVVADWEILSNQLSIDAADGLCICGEVNPDGDDEVVAQVEFTSSDQWENGTKMRLVFDYVDSSNYWFLQAEKSEGEVLVAFYQVSAGGAPVQMGEGGRVVTRIFYFWGRVTGLRLCVGPGPPSYPGNVYGGPLIDGIAFTTAAWAPITPAATKCGVAVANSTDTKTFDNFTLSRHPVNMADCVGCGKCTGCIDGEWPEEFDITISGMTNYVCGYCGDLDGTYRVRKLHQCGWLYEFPEDAVCGAWFLHLTIESDGSILVVLFLVTTGGSIQHHTRWYKSNTAPLDCANLTNYDVPPLTVLSWWKLCYNTSSTCTVTAV